MRWIPLLLLLAGAARAQEAPQIVLPDGVENSDATAPSIPIDAVGVEEMPAGSVKGRVTAEFAEVRAGPGVAYVSRGRVYAGDLVDVRRRDEGKAWVEVVAGGLRGWIRVGAVELARPGAPPPIARGDAGRDRRETNYTYDDQGRRRWPDGTPMGSGEGTEGSDREEPAARLGAPAGPGHLSLRVGLGVMQMGRAMGSDIEEPSALRSLETRPTGASAEVAVAWDAHTLVALRGGVRFGGFGEAAVPAEPRFGLPEPVSVAVDALQVEADAVGRYPLGAGWVGAYAGGRFLRHGFQETRPFPLFLTTTWLGAAVGGAAAWRFGALDAAARGGVLVPLVVSQSPVESGEASGGGGWEAGGEVAWTFTPGLAAVAGFHFARLTIDFRGPSSHADTETGPEPKRYDRARERDTLAGGTLGVRWTPAR